MYLKLIYILFLSFIFVALIHSDSLEFGFLYMVNCKMGYIARALFKSFIDLDVQVL